MKSSCNTRCTVNYSSPRTCRSSTILKCSGRGVEDAQPPLAGARPIRLLMICRSVWRACVPRATRGFVPAAMCCCARTVQLPPWGARPAAPPAEFDQHALMLAFSSPTRRPPMPRDLSEGIKTPPLIVVAA